jgi:hypothetical protein
MHPPPPPQRNRIRTAERTLRAMLSLVPDVQSAFAADVRDFLAETLGGTPGGEVFVLGVANRIHAAFGSLHRDLNLLYGDVFLSARSQEYAAEESARAQRANAAAATAPATTSVAHPALENDEDGITA